MTGFSCLLYSSAYIGFCCNWLSPWRLIPGQAPLSYGMVIWIFFSFEEKKLLWAKSGYFGLQVSTPFQSNTIQPILQDYSVQGLQVCFKSTLHFDFVFSFMSSMQTYHFTMKEIRKYNILLRENLKLSFPSPALT